MSRPQKRSDHGVVFMNYFTLRSKAVEMPMTVTRAGSESGLLPHMKLEEYHLIKRKSIIFGNRERKVSQLPVLCPRCHSGGWSGGGRTASLTPPGHQGQCDKVNATLCLSCAGTALCSHHHAAARPSSSPELLFVCIPHTLCLAVTLVTVLVQAGRDLLMRDIPRLF